VLDSYLRLQREMDRLLGGATVLQTEEQHAQSEVREHIYTDYLLHTE